MKVDGKPDLRPEDPLFVLETDRKTWLAIRGTDEAGRETMFRLAFTTLELARDFAGFHPEMQARRIRELTLADLTTPADPPLALDLDPGSV